MNRLRGTEQIVKKSFTARVGLEKPWDTYQCHIYAGTAAVYLLLHKAGDTTELHGLHSRAALAEVGSCFGFFGSQRLAMPQTRSKHDV